MHQGHLEERGFARPLWLRNNPCGSGKERMNHAANQLSLATIAFAGVSSLSWSAGRSRRPHRPVSGSRGAYLRACHRGGSDWSCTGSKPIEPDFVRTGSLAVEFQPERLEPPDDILVAKPGQRAHQTTPIQTATIKG